MVPIAYGLAADNLLLRKWSLPMGNLSPQTLETCRSVWGLRGGGGNFGVVVSWSIACIRSQPCYRVCALSLEQAVLARFNEFIATSR